MLAKKKSEYGLLSQNGYDDDFKDMDESKDTEIFRTPLRGMFYYDVIPFLLSNSFFTYLSFSFPVLTMFKRKHLIHKYFFTGWIFSEKLITRPYYDDENIIDAELTSSEEEVLLR